MDLNKVIEALSSVTKRPNWDNYFITMAHLTSLRSNCIKRKVGAIVVKENKVLSMGYNGTPTDMTNCIDGGCKRCTNTTESGKDLDLCMCLHAEENAIMFLSREDLRDSTLYCTLNPCIGCLKKIIQCKIKKIVYKNEYNNTIDSSCKELCQMAGVELYKIEFED